MIGKSLPEYVFIRASIFALRAVTPLSIAYLAACAHRRRPLVSPWLAAYAALEAGFYLFAYLPRQARLQQAAVHPPLITRKEREELFQNCFESVSDVSVISGWFHGAPVSTLRRENYVDWLFWAFFSTDREHRQEIFDEWEDEIDGYVTKLEKIVGHKIEPGHNPAVKSLRVTIDPVVAIHRPLFWYMLVFFVDNITSGLLYRQGFRHIVAQNALGVFPPRPVNVLSSQKPLHPQLSYWFRPHRSATKHPVVFLHGIGIGLWPYCNFLADLIRADPDVGIILLEFMPISMHISTPLLGRAALCDALSAVLAAHDLAGPFVLAGHSFGTVLATHVLHDPSLAARVAGTVLVDPIPFLLCTPDVAFNFVYRAPKEANEWQLWFFASRDPDIARTLARHFFWSESVLFKHELVGKRTTVVLAGKDQIARTSEVLRYLTGTDDPAPRWAKDGLEVLFFPTLDHAVIFDRPADRKTLVDVMQAHCANPVQETRDVVKK